MVAGAPLESQNSIFYTRERKGKHVAFVKIVQHAYAFSPLPFISRHGVKPHCKRILRLYPVKPHKARLIVIVFNASIGIDKFPRGHGGVTNYNALVIAVVFVEHRESGNPLAETSCVVFPYGLVYAVVKVVEFKVLELMLGGREKP